MLLLSSVRMGINLGPDRRPLDRHGQRAVHPDPAGLPPEAARLGARRRGAERRPRLVPAEPAVQRPAGARRLSESGRSAEQPRSGARARPSCTRSVRSRPHPAILDPKDDLRVAIQLRDRSAQGPRRPGRRHARADPRRLPAEGQALSSRRRRRGVGRSASWSSRTRCSARPGSSAPPTSSPRPPRRRGPAPPEEPSAETVHAGIHDRDVDPSRIVAVEHLCVRYLWDDASYLWLTQKQCPTRSAS